MHITIYIVIINIKTSKKKYSFLLKTHFWGKKKYTFLCFLINSAIHKPNLYLT